MTGRYLLHATVVNALDLAPPVPSPLVYRLRWSMEIVTIGRRG